MEASQTSVTLTTGNQYDVQMDNPAAKRKLQDQGLEAVKDIIYGSTAGVVGKFIEYPFDTIKVRLQSQPDHLPLRYSGPLDCFRQSWRQNGFASLYRGISAPLIGAAVETSSLFFSYRVAQDLLRATILPGEAPLTMLALLVCGAASGAFTSILLTPIELVKCKMQVPIEALTAATRAPGPGAIIAAVYRHHGITGFWHGQMGTLIRETGGSAAWFGSYEGMKNLFRRRGSIKPQDSLPIHEQMVAGAVAGMSYNFLFYPADTIKSRMQTVDVTDSMGRSRSFWAVGSSLWKQHGIKGLYRGCGITVGRAAPSSAFIFTIYEALRTTFG